jgi:small subunit ribosomal protein S14
MRNVVEKDKIKRKIVLEFETKRIILKSIIRNTNLLNKARWAANLELSDLFVNSSRGRLVNRCVLTGRKSKVRNRYHFSRLTFLKMAKNGLISGLKKSSW